MVIGGRPTAAPWNRSPIVNRRSPITNPMTFLPIIERELRVRARSEATYWVRFAVGIAGALLCVKQLIISGPLNTPAVVGRRVFDEMTGAAFLLCCSACVLAVEAINTERREGTLGLLFLTRV